jgi:hypothetical protein
MALYVTSVLCMLQKLGIGSSFENICMDMGTTLSTRRLCSWSQATNGCIMCVAVKHGVFIISCSTHDKQLHMHSLADGSLVRSVGATGSGKGQFDFDWGGLCVSPDGDSVLVAESHNNRVQQVRIVDGSWVRFVGEGVLRRPQFTDCNTDVIVVSESMCNRVSVLSWADGSVQAQFGSGGSGPGQLNWPRGIRLLADCSEVVVADCDNNRLCVFTLGGVFVEAVGSKKHGLHHPYVVLECALVGVIVSNIYNGNLIKFCRDGAKSWAYGKEGGEITGLSGLAGLPDGGMVVVDRHGARCSIIHDCFHRLQWIGACVSAALR